MILLPSHNLSVKSVARNGGSCMRTMQGLDSREVAPATVRVLFYIIYSSIETMRQMLVFGYLPYPSVLEIATRLLNEWRVGT